MEESACKACPAGMVTPTQTSANCYCQAGLYPDATQACVQCLPGSYCEGGSLIASCPAHSTSLAGAKTRSDCHCEPGVYYGSLALPGSQCMRLPLAQTCAGGSCTCASGWQPIYNLSSDGLTLSMHCIVECSLGEYAQIDASSFAKVACLKCPLHTYSSSKQTVEVVGGKSQCTPCPLNLETNAVGQTSVLDCVCKRGVATNMTSGCGLCASGTYLDSLGNLCRPCPSGVSALLFCCFSFLSAHHKHMPQAPPPLLGL